MKNFNILRNQRKYSPLFILWLAVDQCQCMLVRDNGLISTCSFCNLFFTITKFLVGALQPEDNCVFTSGDWICWVLHQPDQENVENYFLDLVILIIHQDTDGLGMKPTETIASLIVSRYRDKKSSLFGSEPWYWYTHQRFSSWSDFLWSNTTTNLPPPPLPPPY